MYCKIGIGLLLLIIAYLLLKYFQKKSPVNDENLEYEVENNDNDNGDDSDSGDNDENEEDDEEDGEEDINSSDDSSSENSS